MTPGQLEFEIKQVERDLDASVQQFCTLCLADSTLNPLFIEAVRGRQSADDWVALIKAFTPAVGTVFANGIELDAKLTALQAQRSSLK